MSSNSDAHAHGSHGHTPHVLPLWVYLGVFGALMVLTIITVVVAQFDFGAMNMVVAMAVATTKATLVALIFMHLLFDDKFNLIAFLGTFIFVGLFFTFTFLDTTSRGDYDPIKRNYVKEMPPAQTAGQMGKKPEHSAHGEGHGGEHGAEKPAEGASH